MGRKMVYVIVVILVLTGTLPLALAEPRLKTGVVKGSAEKIMATTPRQVSIGSGSPIREFSITPGSWLSGQAGTAILRWRADPNPEGSRLTNVTITKTEGVGPNVNLSSSEARGEHSLSIPASISEGRTTYALTIVNEAGNAQVATLGFEVASLRSLREQISIDGFGSRPSEIMAGSGPFDYTVRINNRSRVAVSGVTIKIHWGFGRSALGNLLAELTTQTINPGMNEYRLRGREGIPEGELAPGGFIITVRTEGGENLVDSLGQIELVRTVNLYRVRLSH